MDPLSTSQIVAFSADSQTVVFKRLGLELTRREWDAYLVSDELIADPQWFSENSVENYLAAERQLPLFFARIHPPEDPFAGEEFTNEF